LILLIGFALGAGLMLWWWPHQPAGVAVPASADLRVMISDHYLANAVQNRVNGMTIPSITNVQVRSLPPAALVVTATLSLGPVSADSSMEVQPVASGGTIQMHIISTHIGPIPIPSQLTVFLEDAINNDTQHLLSSGTRITGVTVKPQGVEILANSSP
jgi:hypothetical protein